jgi:DNA-binding response OmpR family regulator
MSAEILVVDDEEPIASVLKRSLIARGYVVRVAKTGGDALLTLAEGTPDVMLLDINLPDLSGWEVLRRLPPADRDRVPVIVFSASPLAPSRVAEFQPAGVLLKPFPIDALVRLVEDVVSARDNHAQWERSNA